MSHGRKLCRRKGILWDYNGDGQYAAEKISPWWRRYILVVTRPRQNCRNDDR
jgi:hypothetical protein